jgi:hypothetical protein
MLRAAVDDGVILPMGNKAAMDRLDTAKWSQRANRLKEERQKLLKVLVGRVGVEPTAR